MTPEERLSGLLKSARIAAKLDQKEVAGKLDVADGYISSLENGKIPSVDTLLAEADWSDYLTIRAEIERNKQHSALRPFLNGNNPEMPTKAPLKSKTLDEGFLPVCGLASCGSMVEAIRDNRWPHGELRTVEWRRASEFVKSKHAFVVIADGDSMAPTISSGDEILVDPGAKVQNDKIALVVVGGDATVKRWFKVGESILLRPDNPDRKKYPEKVISAEQWKAGNGVAWRVVRIRHTEEA